MIFNTDPMRQENCEPATGNYDETAVAPALGAEAQLAGHSFLGYLVEGAEVLPEVGDEWNLPDASGSWCMTAIDDDFDDSDDDDDDDEYEDEDDFYGDDDDFDDDEEDDAGADT